MNGQDLALTKKLIDKYGGGTVSDDQLNSALEKKIADGTIASGEQLDDLANKGTTVEVLERVTKEEIDRQIADGTIANLTIADKSITREKLVKSIGDNLVLKENFESMLETDYYCKTGDFLDYAPTSDLVSSAYTSMFIQVSQEELKSRNNIRFKLICSDNTPIHFAILNNSKQKIYQGETKMFSGNFEVRESLLDIPTIANGDYYVGIVSEDSAKFLMSGRSANHDRTRFELISVNGGALVGPPAWRKPYFEIYNEAYGKTMYSNVLKHDEIIKYDITNSKFKNDVFVTSSERVSSTTSAARYDWKMYVYPFKTQVLKALQFDSVRFSVEFKTAKDEYSFNLMIVDPSTKATIYEKKNIKVKLIDNRIELPFSNTELNDIDLDNICIGYYCDDITFPKTVITDNDNYDLNATGYYSLTTNINSYKAMPLSVKKTKIAFVKDVCKSDEEIYNTLSIKNKIPNIFVPKNIDVIKGEKFEIFANGCIMTRNPDNYDIVVNAKSKGRKADIVSNTVGTQTYKVEIFDKALEKTVFSENRSITTIDKPSNPASIKNILCIGDSLTDWGTWLTECKRMLMGNGGNPAGLGLTNLNFFGKRKNNHGESCEALGGQKIDYYIGTSSPFYINGKINIKQYCTDCEVENLDIAVIQLGWNSRNVQLNTDEDKVMQLANAIHTDFPNCRVILVGIQSVYMPYVELDATSIYQNEYVYRLNKAYEKKVVENNSWMDFVNIAHQMDTQYNQVKSTENVNTRNSNHTTIRTTDYIHPGSEGYNQMADAMFRCFSKYIK